jgi:hypothetical protein
MRVCQDTLSTAEENGTLDQCCLSVHFEIVKVFQYPKFMIDAPYTSSSSINLPILVQLKTNKKKRQQGSSERKLRGTTCQGYQILEEEVRSIQQSSRVLHTRIKCKMHDTAQHKELVEFFECMRRASYTQ